MEILQAGTECYKDVEDILNTSLPESLKNVLITNGFNQQQLLAQITNNKILEI